MGFHFKSFSPRPTIGTILKEQKGGMKEKGSRENRLDCDYIGGMMNLEVRAVYTYWGGASGLKKKKISKGKS